MTRLVLRFKLIHPSGDIDERVIWSVLKSADNPDGIRYRLAYVRAGKGIEQLINDFENDVKEVDQHENT